MKNLKKKIDPVNCNHSELCTYLQDLEEGYLPTCSLDTHQSVPSSGRTIASKPWQHGKKTGHFPSFQYTMMSKSSAENLGEEKSKSSAEDSHARTFQSPEKERGSKESDLPCGRTWRESLMKFDPETEYSLKTHQCLWDEVLPMSSAISAKWGMVTSDGVLWERITLPHLTSGTGSGSWPTPTAMNDNHYIDNSPNKENRNSRGLASEVDHRQKYPTPTSRDYKGGYKTESLTRKDGKSRATDALPNAVIDGKGIETVTGQLSPDWVEWLMGWPIGWTSMEAITELDWRDWSIDPADGEPSKQSPTPSSNPRGAYIGREMDFETLSTVSNTTGTRYGMTIETYAHHKPGGGEVPRVATGIKNRVGRLKAIGNGQVPQVAALAWQILTK